MNKTTKDAASRTAKTSQKIAGDLLRSKVEAQVISGARKLGCNPQTLADLCAITGLARLIKNRLHLQRANRLKKKLEADLQTQIMASVRAKYMLA